MLKKLRIKFVAIIMASVAVVLAIVFTGICISEYQRGMASVEEALSSSIDRASEGTFGHQRPLGGFAGGLGIRLDDPDDIEDIIEDLMEGELPDQFAGPQIGGRPGEERSLVPVAVYSLSDESGLTVASGYTTAWLDDDVLSAAASEVGSLPGGTGLLSDLGLVYQKATLNGVTYVAFADASYTTGWQSLALTLVIAGICTLAVFFVVALLLSRWALKPVEEAWESQRQFVADASHELKTPLTVVLANTSILLKHPEATIASQSQWVESTQIEAESMQGLVNEMLELAQVESRAGLVREPLDFSDLVDGEVLQFESVAFERGCALEGEVAGGVSVSGDAQRLRKMASTLIENALKYVDDGGTVDVSLIADGKTATLRIRNTGSTISPEDLPHIFDRFYRTDKARTSGTGGFGLGLAIAREIAREHDGDITCQSDASGTTFTVTLPVSA